MDHGQLLESGCDPAAVLEPADATLYGASLSVGSSVEGG